MTIFLSWGRRDGGSRLGWWGRKETDVFLVASEPCQEAQQVQDPSTPLHSPNPGPTSPRSSTTTLLTSPCPQFGIPVITLISRKTRNSTKHPTCCWGSCGCHPLVEVTCLWMSPTCGGHLLVEVTHSWRSPLALPAHTGDRVEGGFWVRPRPHIQGWPWTLLLSPLVP